MKKQTDKHETTIHQWISDIREHYDVQGDEIINKASGAPLGWVDANGVKVANMFGAHHTVAKLIWIHQNGKMPRGQVRKIDLDKPADITNLYDTHDPQTHPRKRKLAEYISNPRNPDKMVSDVTGVSWWAARNKWRIVLKGQYHGAYTNKEEAERECMRIVAEYQANAAEHKRQMSLDTLHRRKVEKVLSGGAPTLAYLEETFRYNPDTGELFYRNVGDNRKMFSGNLQANPYAEALRVGTGKYHGSREYAIIEGKRYYLDQIVWALHNDGHMPVDIYHLNGVKTDTRIYNLSLEQPQGNLDAVLTRTYPKMQSVESVKQDLPIEEDEYDIAYGDYLYHKHEDGRYSYTNQQRETKYGTQEQIRAYLDDVINGDGWGATVKWGELASA